MKKTQTKTKFHNINLIVGDWSGDGHEKTEIIEIKCNLPLEELQMAYKKGSKKVGFDFINIVATDYEDSILHSKEWKKLEKLGCKIKLVLCHGTDKQNPDYDLDYDGSSYVEILLFICSLGHPDLKYKFVEKDWTNQWTIGGYGLFY